MARVVDVERVDLAFLEAFGGQRDVTDERTELLLGKRSDGRAIDPTIGRGGHSPRLAAP